MTPETAPRQLFLLEDGGTAPTNFSPAVRVGDHVFVAGMVSMKHGEVVGVGDIVAQTRQALDNVETALLRAGVTFADIVRYRVYLTDMNELTGVRAVLNDRFGAICPAGTLVGVSALVRPDLMIEIDADAMANSALENRIG